MLQLKEKPLGYWTFQTIIINFILSFNDWYFQIPQLKVFFEFQNVTNFSQILNTYKKNDY